MTLRKRVLIRVQLCGSVPERLPRRVEGHSVGPQTVDRRGQRLRCVSWACVGLSDRSSSAVAVSWR